MVPQHEWATFVCTYPSFSLYFTLLIYHEGNSQLPDLTQTNLVNIYLFHADSGLEVLRVTNETNPFGRAGSIAKQVDDLWFANGGLNFNGSSISYPYYWVITRSDATLDGTEIPQATFSALRECLLSSAFLIHGPANTFQKQQSLIRLHLLSLLHRLWLPLCQRQLLLPPLRRLLLLPHPIQETIPVNRLEAYKPTPSPTSLTGQSPS
jgi:hypothetical protein